MVGERLGDYELVEPLGHGTMGTVWRARQTGRVSREVALKRVAGADPEQAARLRREAEALAALDHPHVVGLFDVVDDGDGLAIVMALATGGSLADLLDDLGRLRPDRAVGILAPIADALASAHRRGVLHRDVKPSNILFTSDGEPLLTDFGVARLRGGEPLTDQTGTALGTAEYLDPAVADGGAPDERADQYALGVVTWQALAGRLPYQGDSPLATLRAADRGERPALVGLAPDAPATLVQAVERASARDPDERFSDCRALAAALRSAELDLPPAGHGEPSGDGPDAAPDQGPGEVPDELPAPPEVASPPAEPEPAGARAFGGRDSGTQGFGAPPPAPEEPAAEPAGWSRWVVAACVGLVLLVAGGVAGVWWWSSPGEEAGAVASRPAPPTASPAPDCPDIPRPDVEEEATLFEADLDGDGCEEYVAWLGGEILLYREPDGGTERAALVDPDGRAAELAERADFAVGDWNCDGAETAAVYDPQTGRVLEFRAWPDRAAGRPRLDDDDVVAYDSDTVGGQLRVEEDGDGCATIVIDGGEAAA